MPKIEVQEKAFITAIGRKIPDDELITLLEAAKAELDGRDEAEGLLKIELNDTNRPDLWSTRGIARQLKTYLSGKSPVYDFCSTPSSPKKATRKVVVDAKLKELRPYIAAFIARGPAIDDVTLKDIIQTQEKLCWNFGRKRKSIAMGVYRSDLIAFPVQYSAVDPDKTRFVPLGLDRELSMREMLTEHPKGVEYGSIVADLPLFPLLKDQNSDVLSFPPIINSDRLGAVEVGDKELFIELTGTDMPSLVLAASILACDMVDSGFSIEPVEIEYPYDTPYGRNLVTPYYFQEAISATIPAVNKLLGVNFDGNKITDCLARMGIEARVDGETVTINPPVYRNDFLHPVDIIEDIMIGHGLNSFEPEMPDDFTVGRLTPAEEFGRTVKSLLVGLGYQEMMYGYLGSRKDYIDRMNIPGTEVIQISNPMTENFEFVRSSILPNLMASESVSGNAVYPHRIFEAGKVAYLSEKENYGSVTRNYLGFTNSHSEAGFTEIHSQVSTLMYYLNRTFELAESDDPRFIPGRAGKVLINGETAGVFGEIHPQVLENWGIGMPVVAAELDLDLILAGAKG